MESFDDEFDTVFAVRQGSTDPTTKVDEVIEGRENDRALNPSREHPMMRQIRKQMAREPTGHTSLLLQLPPDRRDENHRDPDIWWRQAVARDPQATQSEGPKLPPIHSLHRGFFHEQLLSLQIESVEKISSDEEHTRFVMTQHANARHGWQRRRLELAQARQLVQARPHAQWAHDTLGKAQRAYDKVVAEIVEFRCRILDPWLRTKEIEQVQLTEADAQRLHSHWAFSKHNADVETKAFLVNLALSPTHGMHRLTGRPDREASGPLQRASKADLTADGKANKSDLLIDKKQPFQESRRAQRKRLLAEVSQVDDARHDSRQVLAALGVVPHHPTQWHVPLMAGPTRTNDVSAVPLRKLLQDKSNISQGKAAFTTRWAALQAALPEVGEERGLRRAVSSVALVG